MTRSQRHIAYKKLLAGIPKVRAHLGWGYDFGFCHLIYYVFGTVNKENFSFDRVIEENFPELERKKRGNWPKWNQKGWVKRRAMLRQCIKQTAPKKKVSA